MLEKDVQLWLAARLPDLLSGKAAASDIAVFGVWMALLLAPLFSEVSLLGVTLKNEIEELKGHIAAQIADVRADVRNAVDIRATVSPTFNIPPPTDNQLPEIEAQVKAAVAAAFAEQGGKVAGTEASVTVGVVLETASMNEADLAEYCRRKGIFVEQVAAWRSACMSANASAAERAKEERAQAGPLRTWMKHVLGRRIL